MMTAPLLAVKVLENDSLRGYCKRIRHREPNQIIKKKAIELPQKDQQKASGEHISEHDVLRYSYN
jgi:hypothetical protein